ncbi:MAG: hypothetical protein RTV31_16910, partial [Candidatus Thorarchaeota archaeon]
MNRKLLRVKLVSLVIVTIMLVGFIPQAVWAGEVITQEEPLYRNPLAKYDVDAVYIFYDPNNKLLKSIAENVHEVLDFRLENIEMIRVMNLKDLEIKLMDEPWIAIYALSSNLEGVQFLDKNVTWTGFYDLLSTHDSTQHIVGMGNTQSLDLFIAESETNIRTSQAEQVDGLLLAF